MKLPDFAYNGSVLNAFVHVVQRHKLGAAVIGACPICETHARVELIGGAVVCAVCDYGISFPRIQEKLHG